MPAKDPRDRRKRRKHGGDLESAIEEVGDAVSGAVVEVGDAVSAIFQTVTSEWNRHKSMSPAEKLLRAARRKRKDWIGHRNAFIATNLGLVGINVAVASLTGELFPWAVFPICGWGIGLGIHALNYRSWLADNRERIAAAEQELARLGVQEAIAEPSPSIAVDPAWSELVRQCRVAVRAAETSLAKSNDAVLTEQTRGKLQEGLSHLERLAEGAVTISAAIAQVVPDGKAGLDAAIAALDRKIANADPKLAAVYRENRRLLAARHDKVTALQSEHDRMFARAEGFLLAAQNIQLDASRAGVQGPGVDTLTEPLRQLGEEVEILRQVEAELADVAG